MKKLILAISWAFIMTASSSALAATVWGETTNTDSVTGTATGECPLLAETVTLTISANVRGGWACDEGNNIIQVGACHTGGTRKEVPCTSYDASTNAIPGCSDTTGVGTPDYTAFFASSAGGVMQDKALGQRCTEASLGALSDWAN